MRALVPIGFGLMFLGFGLIVLGAVGGSIADPQIAYVVMVLGWLLLMVDWQRRDSAYRRARSEWEHRPPGDR